VKPARDQLHACRAIVDGGCADPDPWRGLCLVIERICELHARDRGFTEAFLSTYPGVKDVAAGREYTLKAVAELARRANRTTPRPVTVNAGFTVAGPLP
jgi:hypothetical protein